MFWSTVCGRTCAFGAAECWASRKCGCCVPTAEPTSSSRSTVAMYRSIWPSVAVCENAAVRSLSSRSGSSTRIDPTVRNRTTPSAIATSTAAAANNLGAGTSGYVNCELTSTPRWVNTPILASTRGRRRVQGLARRRNQVNWACVWRCGRNLWTSDGLFFGGVFLAYR